MAAQQSIKGDAGYNHFEKIKLWDKIATTLASYGVNCGNADLMDYLDLTYGAIPDGPYSLVVDCESPMQFLSMYTKIAEGRFACAVTELIKMDPENLGRIKEFCKQVGVELAQETKDLESAIKLLDFFVLDGMPFDETKKIISKDESKIIWEKIVDTHEPFWEKAGGDLSTYYEVLSCFVSGLLSYGKYEYQIENCCNFTLQKK